MAIKEVATKGTSFCSLWLMFDSPGRIFLHQYPQKSSAFRNNRSGTTGARASVTFNDRRFLLKRHLAITLAVIITALSFGLPVTATAQSTTDAEKIRTKVQTLSASKNSLVQVKFRDQTKVKGYIDSVE